MNYRFISGISVLIHGGAGALGQAAISICLAFKCKVFTTVSDRQKKAFLLKLFPELKGMIMNENIFIISTLCLLRNIITAKEEKVLGPFY